MGTLLPENLCAHRKGAIEELIKVQARDMAAQPTGDHDGPEELLVKLLTSFTVSLSNVFLSSCDCEDCECEVSQIPNQVGSPRGDRRLLDLGESSKRPASNDRRGSSKRRMTSERRMELLTTNEDGQAWRIYRRKKILNAQFPRCDYTCYFVCPHKPDQGCQAKKQVQMIHMYQTTYIGHHTCRSYSPNNPSVPSQNPAKTITTQDPEPDHPRSFTSETISTQYTTTSGPCSTSSVRKDCGEESQGTGQSTSVSGDLSDTEPSVHGSDTDDLLESDEEFDDDFGSDEESDDDFGSDDSS